MVLALLRVFAAVSFRQCRVYDWGGLQKETALESSWSFCSDRSSFSDVTPLGRANIIFSEHQNTNCRCCWDSPRTQHPPAVKDWNFITYSNQGWCYRYRSEFSPVRKFLTLRMVFCRLVWEQECGELARLILMQLFSLFNAGGQVGRCFYRVFF